MGRRNLTIQLDQETIRWAKILAAQRGTSISGLVSQTIEELMSQAHRYEAAQQKILYYLDNPPFRLGGKRSSREELHDRKGLRR